MSQYLKRLVFPLAKSYALGFLGEKNIGERLEGTLESRLSAGANTGVGKKLGLSTSSRFSKVPLTSYGFYKQFFDSPNEGDFLYPLSDYIRVTTSGTMGKPKSYLLPKSGLWDCLKKAGFASMLVYTHDGERVTFEVGDIAYTNVPGGSHISSFLTDIGSKQNSGLVVQCPDPNLSFDKKVDYFVQNYKSISFAYMNVTTLFDQIYPRIGEPIHLKGFVTQDRSAAILKDEIKKITGNYPKSAYGSTETMKSTIPSIEHPGAFFFDWRILYPEFIPEADAITGDFGRLDEPPETIKMMDVEVGKRYQLVATPFKNDLMRYVMPDIFECVDDGDDVLGSNAPVFAYYARSDRIIVLHNFTRISEEELAQVLFDAKIPFIDFTARREAEGTRDYLTIYVELSKKMTLEEVAERADARLFEFDKDWKDLKNFLKYNPLRVRLLPRGSFSRYLASQKGLPKVERVEMSDDHLVRLLSGLN
jgi:hypothetical protein